VLPQGQVTTDEVGVDFAAANAEFLVRLQVGVQRLLQGGNTAAAPFWVNPPAHADEDFAGSVARLLQLGLVHGGNGHAPRFPARKVTLTHEGFAVGFSTAPDPEAA